MDAKKNTFIDLKLADPEIQKERARWRGILKFLVLYCASKLVFVDETAIYTHMRRARGKGKRGKRVVIKHRSRSIRHTLIGAVRLGKLFAKRSWGRPMTQKDFVLWVQQVLVPQLEPGSFIIWDNLKLHKAASAINALLDEGHFVFFQSRYSPEYNPIEKVWSQIKQLAKGKRSKGAKEMKAAVEWAWGQVTPDHIESYFVHCLVDNVYDPPW